MMSDRNADPGSLLGQLQRGRGIGVRRALAEPGAAAEPVLACVVRDARWDPSGEARDEYLASLVQRLALPLDPVAEHLAGVEAGVGVVAGRSLRAVELPLQVLGRLVELGREDAVPILRRYLAEGEHWRAALAAVRDWKAAGRWDGADRDLLARPDIDDEQLTAAVAAGGPWPMWAERHPRLREIIAGLAASRRVLPKREPIQKLSSEALLARITADGGEHARELLVLAGRGDLVVLDLAEDTRLRAAGAVPNLDAALRCLGAPAVDRARTWAAGADPELHALAIGVLAAAGDRSDARTLTAAFEAAVRAEDWSALENPAKGLGRLGVLDAGDLLVGAWQASDSSTVRAALLSGLAGCVPAGFEEFAIEGLDDCEGTVQEVACDRVPLTPDVIARLQAWQTGPDLWERRWLAGMRLAVAGAQTEG